MNLFKAFIDLIPTEPLRVGTVIEVHGDETSIVELLDGARIRVRGTSVEAGKKAFVRAGAIEGEAPNLPIVEIEI
jgi:hypothetical protein